jgi:hypothetical protein
MAIKRQEMVKLPLIKVCLVNTLGHQTETLTAIEEQVDILYTFDSYISNLKT